MAAASSLVASRSSGRRHSSANLRLKLAMRALAVDDEDPVARSTSSVALSSDNVDSSSVSMAVRDVRS